MYHPREWFEDASQRLGLGADDCWFAAQLKPNCLAIARRNLERQGFRVLAPMTIETRRSGGRFRTEPRPLFPGYVFVAVDLRSARWRAINSTQGVTRLVSFGGRPAPLPAGLAEQIALQCDADGVLRPVSDLEPGCAVLVTEGPFAGFIAEVEAIDPDRRVWVLLDLMGHQTRLGLGQGGVKRA